MSIQEPTYSVLIIEDDLDVCAMLREYLKESAFRLIEAHSAHDGLSAILEKRPDIILLDLGLPDGDGIHLVKSIREWSRTPILIMSGRVDDEDKVEALDAGADDYVTKPFSMIELMARVRVAVRHLERHDATEPTFESGPLRIDFSARQVWLNDDVIKLTPLEYKLLALLVKHSGKVVTQRQLLSEVWGAEYTEDAQYLRVYMGYLRKKLEPSPGSPKLILTEHRIGYRLVV